MRRPLLLCGLVLCLPWLSTAAPPRGNSDGCAIVGTVARYGFPAKATIELRKIRDLTIGAPPRIEQRVPHVALREPPVAMGPPLAMAETDDEGTFAFRGLAIGEYEVRATRGDVVASTTAELSLPGMHARAWIEVREPETKLRSGRVRWADGAPFRGIVAIDDSGCETDEEGRFTVRGTGEPGEHVLLWAEGRVARGIAWPEEGAEFTVDADLGDLAGVVTEADGKTPVPGVWITAVTEEEERGFAVTGGLVGADGVFVVRGVADTELHVGADGYLEEVVEHPGEDIALFVHLQRAPVVSGRVVSAVDGQPLPNVPVFLLELVHDAIETGRFASPAGAHTVTDAQGRYEIASPVAGDVMLFVFGRGYLTPGLEEATSGGYNPAALRLEAGGATEIDIPAEPSPSLVGRLTDGEGRGVPGVLIDAACETHGKPTAQWRMGWFGELAQAATGADGTYRIPTLLPGLTWTLSAWPAGRPGAEAEPVTPKGTEEVCVDLKLPGSDPDRYVVVTVVAREGGTPVAGASVSVAGEAREDDAEEEYDSGRTGPDGRVRLGPFTRNRVAVGARHGDFAPSPMTEIPGSKGVAREIEARVEMEAGEAIAGRAVYPDGRPAAGGRVSLGRSGSGVSYQHPARTDDEGRFRIAGLMAGEYELRVEVLSPEGEPFRGRATTAAGTEDLVLTLERDRRRPYHPGPEERRPTEGPGIEIKILDADGAPIDQGVVVVRTWNEYGRGGGMVAAPDTIRFRAGRATFTFDEYEKAVWFELRPPAETGLGAVLEGPFTVEDSPVTLTIGPAQRIAGAVVDGEGRGVRGVRVYAAPVNAGMEERKEVPDHHGAAWTDPEGDFAIEGLGAGEYDLFVRGPSSLRSEAPLRVLAGEENVELELVSADVVEVRVLDPKGEPVHEAEVHVHLPGAERPLYAHNAVASDETDESGLARLGHLDPEREYVLAVEPGWNREDLTETEIEPWRPADTTVELAAERVVAGRVVDEDGYPLVRARMWLLIEGEEERQLWAEPDGSFEIHEAPRGPIRLLIASNWAEREDEGLTEVTIEEGDDEPEIVLDPGPCVTVRVEGWPEDATADTHWYWQVGRTSSYPKRPLRPDGRQRLHGAPPGGTYCFHVALPDGRMAHAMNLESGRKEHVLTLRPGKTIRGKLALPPGAHDVRLGLWGPKMQWDVEVAPGGAFEVIGLPEGSYSLFARAKVGRTEYGGKAKTEPGTEVEILLVEED